MRYLWLSQIITLVSEDRSLRAKIAVCRAFAVAARLARDVLEKERAVLANDELLSFWQAALRGTDGRKSADEAVHDLVSRLNDRVADHDGRFDVRPDESRSVSDRGGRTHVRLRSDHAILTDH